MIIDLIEERKFITIPKYSGESFEIKITALKKEHFNYIHAETHGVSDKFD